jgi:hypothetical protein
MNGPGGRGKVLKAYAKKYGDQHLYFKKKYILKKKTGLLFFSKCYILIGSFIFLKVEKA